MEPKGRNKNPLAQSPGLGTLLKKLCAESSAVLLLMNVIPALTVLSCQREDLRVTEDTSGTESSDSTANELSSVTIDYYTKCRLEDIVIERLDIFIYGNEGTRSLLSHQSISEGLDVQGHLNLSFPGGGNDKAVTAVFIANCPKALNIQALSRFDSMSILESNFADDRPEAPLLTGSASVIPSGGPESTSQIMLTPMLSRVILTAVTNGLSGYELLEDPQVLLHDITPSAKVLQQEEFRPSETIESGKAQPLPCDVGFYTQYPNLSLYCYPNDTPETTLGSPRTSLEFTCRIKGVECSFPVELPPVARNSIIRVELTVNGVNDYSSTILE